MQQPGQDGDYQVLFAEPEAGAGPATRTVMDRLADRGLPVITTRTWEGLRSALAVRRRAGPGTAREADRRGAGDAPPASAAPIGAAVLSWELFGSEAELAAALEEIQRLSAPPPVVVLSEADGEQAVPRRIAARAAGLFWLRADSPHFVADQVEWLIKTFALRTEVLGALAAGGQDPAGLPAPG